MSSPMKHVKKTRKNTFGQVAVVQSEVGDFQGGYFVMPDASSSKENDCPKTRAPNTRVNTQVERSPARRKHQHDASSPSLSSPHKERSLHENFKKPYAEMTSSDVVKKEGLLAMPSPKKAAPASPKHQHMEVYSCDQKQSSNKDNTLSTSPSSSCGRWAGPAFGNAPHPSSLPLPEFPPMWNSSSSHPSSPSVSVSTPSHHFMTPDAHLSKSPPSFLGMIYQQQHPHHPSSFPHPAPSSSSPPLSSIPAAPFPYVGAYHPPHPSLAQLSTDLRRMLNIAGPVPAGGGMGSMSSDPIMISANSA